MGNTQMDLAAAKAFILKHKSEGLTNKEIANRLRMRGYVSDRTGKPIDEFGVGYHVRDAKVKKTGRISLVHKEAGPAHPGNGHVQAPRGDSRIRLALEVLTAGDIDPTVAKEIAAKLLNS